MPREPDPRYYYVIRHLGHYLGPGGQWLGTPSEAHRFDTWAEAEVGVDLHFDNTPPYHYSSLIERVLLRVKPV